MQENISKPMLIAAVAGLVVVVILIAYFALRPTSATVTSSDHPRPLANARLMPNTQQAQQGGGSQ